MTSLSRLSGDDAAYTAMAEMDDGAEIFIRAVGQGRTLLLVHGWTMSSRFWSHQLVGLSGEFQVVAPELRAHGYSITTMEGLTLKRYAQDLRDIIEALDLQDVVLAGWSLAGPLVLEYWRRYGDDRVSALALVEMTPCPLSAEPWNTHRLAGGGEPEVEQLLAVISADRLAHVDPFVRSMFHDNLAPDDDHAWMMQESLKTSTDVAVAIYGDYLRCNYIDTLATVTVPALAAYGQSGDGCFGPKCGEFVAGQLPRGELRIFEQSGHMPFWEQADEFNQAMRDLAARG